ncbi:MAG: molecular chaperone DnaJ [Clostridia bacterium]|nr:molecular chaperone DnaJ [Deltaproteobacteria bacterium]
MRELYEVLGVERSADAQAIKRAFRSLAQQLHPDKNPGNQAAEERFKEVTHAYEILSDDGLRARYDRLGFPGINSGSRRPTRNAKDMFGEIFGDIFGKTRGTSVREKGRDRDVALTIDFKSAVFGTERMITSAANGRCEPCRGTGARPGSVPQICHACGGTGGIRVQHSITSIHKLCAYCKGRGKVISDPCDSCDGEGMQARKAQIRVVVPSGTENGAVLRFSGQGEAGPAGSSPGDLAVTVNVEPHPIFHRDRDDLQCELPVTFAEAVLGLPVEVPTLEGRVRMRLPSGTQNGRVFRLRGKGIPKKNGERGDQHVKIYVELPIATTDHERGLLAELARSQEPSRYPVREAFWKKQS